MSAPFGLDHPLLTAEEEQQLARRAHDGDIEARNRLVECNLKLIWSEARKYGESMPEEDAFSAGVEAALGAIDYYKLGNGRLAPYLRVVVRRAMYEALPPEDEVALPEHGSTEDVVEAGNLTEDTRTALADLFEEKLRNAHLDPIDASVIALLYGLGEQEPLSNREAAAELGIPTGSVWKRHHRALTALRASFATEGKQTAEDVLREVMENE